MSHQHPSGRPSLGSLAPVRTSLQKRAWYIDRFGLERECIVVMANAFGAETVLMILDLDGQPLKEVKPEDVYFVPANAPG